MTSWIVVTSTDNFQRTIDLGFTKQGFKARQRKKVMEQMAAGDDLLYYVTGVQVFAATARITSDGFEEHELIWTSKPGEDYPWRVEVRPDRVLVEEDWIPTSEIAPGLEAANEVGKGTIEMCHTASYYYWGKDPTYAFGTAVPFGLNCRQQNGWMYHGGGIDTLNAFFKDYGTIAFPAGNTGAQMGGWFRNEVTKLDDFKGLKMRIPGLGGQVMARLGAVPQALPGGDIYPALERGAIDATEWVGPYDDEKLGFYKIAKNYYYPGWWEPCSMYHVMINLEKWNGLPKAYQEAIISAARETNLDMVAEYDAKNRLALTRLKAAGVTIRKFSDEILEGSFKAATAMYDEEAAKNPKFKAIYDSWKTFRAEEAQWFALAESAMDQFFATKL